MSRTSTIASRNKALAERRAVAASRHTHITLVEGPPCSGKSTYVKQHMQSGDVVVDYDALAVALGSPHTHDHPRTLWPFILQARDAVLDRMTRANPAPRAWIIRCEPTAMDRQMATDTVVLDVDADTCKARARANQRPAKWDQLIDEWHTKRGSAPL